MSLTPLAPPEPALPPLPAGHPSPLFEQLSTLGEMATAMSRARSVSGICQEALAAVARIAGTNRASVLLFDPEGVMRFVAWRGLSDGYRAAVEGHTPWSPGQDAPTPILIPDARRDESLGAYQEKILAEGICALGFIPLVTGGGTIGKFMVYHDAPHQFGDAEIQLLRQIGAFTAFAVERQRAVDDLTAERRLFTSGPTVVYRCHAAPNWVIDYVSPNIRDQFGWNPEEVVAQRMAFLDLVHPEDRAWAVAEDAEYIEARIPAFSQIYRLRHADGGHRWVHDFTVVNRDAAGAVTHYHGYLLDVTERKAAAEIVREAEAHLSETQRLESLGLLAGGIAHDFNNLLMGVLGNASLALGVLAPEAPAWELVKDIETAAQRAADLTRQLLAYSGKGHFVVQPLDLSALVRESGRLLATVLSKKADVRYDLAEDLPAVEGDATELRQVIMNLLTNASDALGERAGSIRVRTGMTMLEEGARQELVHATVLPAGRYIVLEVCDSGVGMAEATMRRMFDPFFTTKVHGRGLGLAAVLGIARGHRGGLRVETESGGGTTVRLYLPPSTRELPGEAIGGSTPVPESTGDMTVLIVDDEPMVRDVARRTLIRGGYRVLEASNGRVAMETMTRQGQEVGLILLDLTMPEVGGEETLAWLQANWPDVPVILSSGYSAETEPGEVVREGAAGFIQKPYLPGDLLRAVLGVRG